MAREQKVEAVERTEICKFCRYIHFAESATECRRLPPTVVYNVSTGRTETRVPIVEVTHWCGEFAPLLSS